jgi:hypothetical protein
VNVPSCAESFVLLLPDVLLEELDEDDEDEDEEEPSDEDASDEVSHPANIAVVQANKAAIPKIANLFLFIFCLLTKMLVFFIFIFLVFILCYPIGV